MPPPPVPPSSDPDPDPELRKTLDRLCTLVASASDRVDKQTDTLGSLRKTAAETRTAAFAARAQTDPKLFEQAIGTATALAVRPALATLLDASRRLQDDHTAAKAHLDELGALKATLLQDARHRRERAKRAPWRRAGLAGGAVLLALALTLAVPRLMTAHPATCRLAGGYWSFDSHGQDICVFQAP